MGYGYTEMVSENDITLVMRGGMKWRLHVPLDVFNTLIDDYWNCIASSREVQWHRDNHAFPCICLVYGGRNTVLATCEDEFAIMQATGVASDAMNWYKAERKKITGEK